MEIEMKSEVKASTPIVTLRYTHYIAPIPQPVVQHIHCQLVTRHSLQSQAHIPVQVVSRLAAITEH